MESFITSLTTGANSLTGSTLWTEVGFLVPLILTLFVFVFGWKKATGLIRGGANGKLKIK